VTGSRAKLPGASVNRIFGALSLASLFFGVAPLPDLVANYPSKAAQCKESDSQDNGVVFNGLNERVHDDLALKK